MDGISKLMPYKSSNIRRMVANIRPNSYAEKIFIKKEAIVADAHSIRVTVHTEFLREQSEPANARFAFSYTITISNQGKHAARLLSRHWFITDSDGKVQEVQG